MRSDEPSTIANVLESSVMRGLYFIGCFFCLSVAAGEAVPASLLLTSELWIVIAVLSLVGALVGPGLYHRHTMRGRGSLKDIKEDGWYDGD